MSVAYLRENFPQLGDHIIEQDFLKMDLRQLFDGQPFVLTGNYPYNISSQIFFKMLDYKDLIPCCTGMIQKEVAERIAARPGNKTYGILSILIQAWYSVEYLFTVHEHVFNPPPKVKSAVIRMTRNETKELGCNEQLFKQIVKTTFNQRRKTLRNSISPILEKGNPLSADPIFNKRPEQLSVQDFIDLTNRVEEALNSSAAKAE
jgi:16S rRNA (adenine1518-N6/adenine1519-N6)-dimethyltransferase